MQSISTIGLDIAWRLCGRPGGPAPTGEAPAGLGIFPETAAMPGGYRGVRLIAPLVPRAAGAGAYGTIDASSVCLRQAAEERRHGCGGDLRSGQAR
jgi:hypothetical protein